MARATAERPPNHDIATNERPLGPQRCDLVPKRRLLLLAGVSCTVSQLSGARGILRLSPLTEVSIAEVSIGWRRISSLARS